MKNRQSKRRFLLSALCLLILGITWAQSDFRPGYILLPSGDSLRGLVDYRGPILSAQRCRFRTDRNAPVQEFLPADLRGYGIDGDKRLLSVAQDDLISFYEVLIEGPVRLFRGEKRFFLQKDSAGLAPLEEEQRTLNRGEQKLSFRYRRYTGLLRYYLSDISDPVFVRQVETTKLRENQLVELISVYHERLGLPYLYYKKEKPFIALTLSPLLGIGPSRLIFNPSGADNELIGEINYRFRPNPLAGIGFNLLLPRISERLSLQLDLIWQRNNYAGLAERVNCSLPGKRDRTGR